jgi:hypothetical protein
MACGLCVAAVFWKAVVRRTPIKYAEFHPDRWLPCPSSSPEMLLTVDVRGRPLEEPRVEFELGTRLQDETVFATYGRPGGDRRSTFFIIKKAPVLRAPFITVDARFDTHYGDYVVIVNEARSDVHVHEDELCFDLTVERGDTFAKERWQGRLSLK